MKDNQNLWIKNSKKNLLPLSKIQDFRSALKEWEFTGHMLDHEDQTHHCELCEHENLRYHYEIQNTITHNKLLVGSSCILRFQEITILNNEGIQLVNKEDRKQILNQAFKKAKIDSALKPLRELWIKDLKYRNCIEYHVNHFLEKDGFLPTGIGTLCSRMIRYGIKFHYSLYPVYLRSYKSQDQLVELDQNRQQHVINCMSPIQKQNWLN